MNDPQLNLCINVVSDLFPNDLPRQAAVIAIVREAYMHGRHKALVSIEEYSYSLRVSGSAS